MPSNQTASKLVRCFYTSASPSQNVIVCRLAYAMDMLCIVCELVVAVCTLVYLFNLQQTVDGENGGSLEHRSREMTLGFMSLGFTVATLLSLIHI